MKRTKPKLAGAMLLAAIAMPASAQTQVTYATYVCNNDVRLAVAYGPGYASIQIDGKSLELPHRLISVSDALFQRRLCADRQGYQRAHQARRHHQ